MPSRAASCLLEPQSAFSSLTFRAFLVRCPRNDAPMSESGLNWLTRPQDPAGLLQASWTSAGGSRTFPGLLPSWLPSCRSPCWNARPRSLWASPLPSPLCKLGINWVFPLATTARPPHLHPCPRLAALRSPVSRGGWCRLCGRVPVSLITLCPRCLAQDRGQQEFIELDASHWGWHPTHDPP